MIISAICTLIAYLCRCKQFNHEHKDDDTVLTRYIATSAMHA